MKRLFLLFYVLVCAECKAQDLGNTQKKEIYEVLNTPVSSYGNTIDLYFKSFSSKKYDGGFIKNKLFYTIINLTSKKSELKGLHKIDSVKKTNKIPKIKRENIIDSIARIYLIPRVEDFLGQDDLDKMAKTANRSLKWDKKKIRHELTRNRVAVRYSVPVFNIENTISMVFVEFLNSLSVRFFEKKNGKDWEFLCSGTIYRAD